MQKPEKDFYETFLPVVRSSSVRLLAAVAAEEDLDIQQIDIVTAYLSREFKEGVFMKMSECLSKIMKKISAGKSIGSSGASVSYFCQLNIIKQKRKMLSKNIDNLCALRSTGCVS